MQAALIDRAVTVAVLAGPAALRWASDSRFCSLPPRCHAQEFQMSASHADQPTQTVSYPQLIDLLRRIFVAHGTSPEVADVLAENCASA
ncbi:DpkA, partial [Pseudomonas syringae pv. coriandricola]